MRFNHFVKLSGALLLTTGLSATASATDYSSTYNGQTAHEACKSDESRGKLIGGGLGAVAGAVLGSQVSGNGARTEGSVIGGLLGGLAGAGIADKRVDCDPVYSSGHQTSSVGGYSGGTYTSSPSPTTYGSTTYSSGPTYSTTQSSGYHQTAGYQQVDYGTRTTVSDHPVYSNPTWGAQPARTYVSQPVSQPVYSQPTYQTASYSQPRVVSSSRTYSSQPTTTYVRPATTTYVQPTRTYVEPTPTYVSSAPRRHYGSYGHRTRHHHHGRHACSAHH